MTGPYTESPPRQKGGVLESEAPPSKALLAAFLELQDRVRELEREKAGLIMEANIKDLAAEDAQELRTQIRQVRDACSRSVKDVEDRNRVVSRQMQTQLKETVSALTIRHQAEIEGIRIIEGVYVHVRTHACLKHHVSVANLVCVRVLGCVLICVFACIHACILVCGVRTWVDA